MNNQLTTTVPNIEKLRMHDASFTAYADMTLAMIPVTVSGQYNIHSNCFYPSTVHLHMDMTEDYGGEYYKGSHIDFDSFCETLGWDQSDTYELVQEAVEKRDQ